MDSCDATIHHAVTKRFLSKLNWTLCVLLKNLKEMCDIHLYFVIFKVEVVCYLKIILRQVNSSCYFSLHDKLPHTWFLNLFDNADITPILHLFSFILALEF